MMPYILHVALLLSVCLLFYKALLQKETFYRLNRMVLAFCLVLSFMLPLIPIPQQWALRGRTQVNEVNSVMLPTNQQATIINQNDATKKQEPANVIAYAKPAKTALEETPLIQRSLTWLF